MDYIKNIGGTASQIRGDRETENSNMVRIQHFLRRNDADDFAKETSFMYGKSVANQRIEAWWFFQRQWSINWWINYFKDLRDRGIINILINMLLHTYKFIHTHNIYRYRQKDRQEDKLTDSTSFTCSKTLLSILNFRMTL